MDDWRKLSDANSLAIGASNYALGTLRNAEVIKALGMMSGVRNGWTANRDGMLTHQAVPVTVLEE